MESTLDWKTECPVVQTLQHVGDRWNVLVLLDVFRGAHRFDALQASLGIAPNILSARLTRLVESEFLEKRLYQERPPRHSYHLTDRGRDFIPLLFGLLDFGNKHFAPHGPKVAVVDKETTQIAEPVLVDQKTGIRITGERFAIAATRSASKQTQAKYPLQVSLPPGSVKKKSAPKTTRSKSAK
jgi:DNA-binding HxlR family transcriptional regulator